jgi:HEPN domain-containing protein
MQEHRSRSSCPIYTQTRRSAARQAVEIAQRKVDPEAIFLQAIEFHIAFRALQEWKPGHPKPGHPSREGAMDKPAAVINAFSSELLLKTLICIETGHIPRGHHMLSLFNTLSPKTRKRITERWDAYAIEYADRWPEIEARIGCPVARDLPTALRLGSKTFELVRYYYEGERIFSSISAPSRTYLSEWFLS